MLDRFMRNLYCIFCICVLLCFSSCKKTEKEVTLGNENPISFVFIELLPDFEPLTMFFDLSRNLVVIRRIGPKKLFRSSEYPVIEKTTALKTLSFRMNLCDYSFLRDSLVFGEEDFVDRVEDVDDGMLSSFLFIFDNGEVRDVDLNNDFTNNQRELVKRIIDNAIDQSQDSISVVYFRNLREYYL